MWRETKILLIDDDSVRRRDLAVILNFLGEENLKERWMKKVESVISQTNLTLPDWNLVKPELGGRLGTHTAHLQPLFDEMSEVFKIDPTSEW